MYGCVNPVLVYGFNMGNREYIIYPTYLEEMFPDISEYALDVGRNYLGEAVYGISCQFDKNTGKAFICNYSNNNICVNNDDVHKLYDKYITYLKKYLSQEEYNILITQIKLGYHLALSCDYELCHENLILDHNWLDNNWKDGEGQIDHDEDEYEENNQNEDEENNQNEDEENNQNEDEENNQNEDGENNQNDDEENNQNDDEENYWEENNEEDNEVKYEVRGFD